MNINDIILNKNGSTISALEMIKNSGLRCILIVNDNKALIGTLSEGDILDGLLRGQTIHSPIKNFFNRNFSFICENFSEKEKNIFLQDSFKKGLTIIPVLDNNGIPIRYYDYKDFLEF